jgi:hypothetical protein
MKLDRDCVRDVLLAVESLNHDEVIQLSDFEDIPLIAKHDPVDVVYSIERLIEAGYIKGNVQYADNRVFFLIVSSLTWNGHEFLDNIRDDGVWKTTKNVASKLSSVSLSTLSSIASSVISKIISQELGLK